MVQGVERVRAERQQDPGAAVHQRCPGAARDERRRLFQVIQGPQRTEQLESGHCSRGYNSFIIILANMSDE